MGDVRLRETGGPLIRVLPPAGWRIIEWAVKVAHRIARIIAPT